jgi:hypothetical protein
MKFLPLSLDLTPEDPVSDNGSSQNDPPLAMFPNCPIMLVPRFQNPFAWWLSP